MYCKKKLGSKCDSHLDIRISKDDVNLFFDSCYALGLKPSVVIREFMQNFPSLHYKELQEVKKNEYK